MFSGIKSLWEAVTNLPGLIANAIKGFFDDVVNAVKSLPNTIINGIKSIFVPDADYIETAFNSFIEELKFKFNIDTSAFEHLFDSEQPVEDIYMDYNISGVGDFKFKVLDTSFFKEGVSTLRPLVRGFIVLLLLFYNIKQLIGFFGYDAGVVAGRQEWVSYNKTNTGGHKE